MNVARELRFALRQLRRTPGFTITVILTLALGIGATTAVFSLVEGVLLRPLPFSDPDGLVLIGDHVGASPHTGVTAREIATYASASDAFSSLGGYTTTSVELSGSAIPQQLDAARLTAGVFPTLGTQPLLGRVFTPADEDTRRPLAVISYALWLTRFDRDPHVLGSTIVLDRRPYSVIGVMPRSFEFPLATGRLHQTQLWVPMNLTPDELSLQQAGDWRYQIVARLKPGVTLAQASHDTDRVAHEIMRSFPPSMSALHIRGDATSLREQLVADARPLLRTLLLAVLVVLLISCVNVAALLLVRAVRRRRAFALRLALGARPRVIVRESVFEGLLLSLCGGLLGLIFAALAIRTALHLLPESMPRISSISLDTTVVIFDLTLALATGVLSSIAPAFAALRTNITEVLKEGSDTGTAAASHSRLRSALVVAEIGIALVLLTVSGALVRSFQRMTTVNPGFRPDHVLVAGYQLPLTQYPTNVAADNFRLAVVSRLASTPGVAAAGVTSALPASGFAPESTYTVEDEAAADWKLKFAAFSTVDGEYFQSMGIPLLDGRVFTPDDRADTPPVVILNQVMAEHAWPGQRAIGRRIHAGNPRKGLPWATVVGVVADTKLGARDEPDVEQWYVPEPQPVILFGPSTDDKLSKVAGGYITLRSALPSTQMVQTLRAAVAHVDPLLALDSIQPMGDVIAGAEAPRSFDTGLITTFALSALLLAVIGIYAVVAFSVSLRTQEIAIRMALGAERAGIARLVLLSGTRLALIGCALGVLGSLAVSRLITSLLFRTSATDPLIYTASVAIMLLLALLASALPAIRAASADPVQALRST